MHRFNRYVILVLLVLLLVGSCQSDTPKLGSEDKPVSHVDLLEQLTSKNEAERFKVLDAARSQLPVIKIQEIESVLTDPRPKNVSTLIYVHIKEQSEALYQLSILAKTAVENSEGSFPNIAYYYSRVEPSTGVNELYRLYAQHPGNRMAICKAIGEVPGPSGYGFLLTEAKSEISSGNRILNQLAGMKSSDAQTSMADLEWFLDKKLDREELIALSELEIKFSNEQLMDFWISGGRKKAFATEIMLGDPDQYLKTLQWVISQHLESGETDEVRQILLSDSIQKATADNVVQYRDQTLKELN
jgi:hypothetical protein